VIETEREKVRASWDDVRSESKLMYEELDRFRRDTEDWCDEKKEEILLEWKQVDELAARMSVLMSDTSEVIPINCCGELFDLPKAALRHVEGSILNHMFSDAFIINLPRDADENFFVEFNPFCFGVVVQYLERLLHNPDASMPAVPPEQQMNMDLLVEALQLKVKPNRLQMHHCTSLAVTRSTIEAKQDGWQVVSAEYPLALVGLAYFEVKVLANPSRKGGLSVGVCGHVPQGEELHHVRLPHSVMYSSNNGLIGDGYSLHNVKNGLLLSEGCTLGARHDVNSHTITWYHNRACIGSCVLDYESLEYMHTLYPVFALFGQGQKIEVDFGAPGPLGRPPPEPAEDAPAPDLQDEEEEVVEY